jgi:hypothetical protein
MEKIAFTAPRGQRYLHQLRLANKTLNKIELKVINRTIPPVR